MLSKPRVSQRLVSGRAATASLGNLLEIQITELENLGYDLGMCFASLQVILMWVPV